jgi:hypothetical protein
MSKKDSETEIVWHGQQENILKKWSEIGSSYRFMHDRAFIHYEKQNFRFALPVIVISTVTGTANFAQGAFPESWQSYVPLFAGFLNLSAGLITTIAQFLRVSELLEGHRAASIAYSKFSRNISVELSLPVDERSCGGREFISNRRVELDRLIEQSPNIPLHIVKLFGKKFQDSEFIKPDILEITGVEVYKDSMKEKEERVRKELEIKESELKLIKDKKSYEDNIVAKIRKEEADRQSHFEAKLKQKLLEARNNLQVNKRIRSAEKKKKVGITNVTKSMASLIKKLEDVSKSNDIITPDSSDFDEPTPTFSSKKTKPFNLTIDVANEIIKKSPLVEPPHEEDGGDEGVGDETGQNTDGDETGQNTDGDETGQNTDGDETGQNIGEIVIDISSNEQ